VFRKGFGSKKVPAGETLEILHKKKLQDLSRTPSISKTVNSRIIQWVKNMARTKETNTMYKILVKKPNHLEISTCKTKNEVN
jgi:hypothetical protein